MKSWLEKKDIEIYPASHEEKPVDTEKLIRTLKNKFYKHMTAI